MRRTGRRGAPSLLASHHGRRTAAGPGDGGAERGASLVEFALVAPILCLLLFGIIDFGITLSDTIALRQGVREAGRQATVATYGSTTSCDLAGVGSAPDDMKKLICLTKSRSEVPSDRIRVAVRYERAGSTVAPGDGIVVCTMAPMRSITGFFDPILEERYVHSKVTMRVEKATSSMEAVSETAFRGESWSWCRP